MQVLESWFASPGVMARDLAGTRIQYAPTALFFEAPGVRCTRGAQGAGKSPAN